MLIEAKYLEDLPNNLQTMLNISDYNKGEHVEIIQDVLKELAPLDEDMARETMIRCLDLKMKHYAHTSPKVAKALRQAADFEFKLKNPDFPKAIKYAKQATRLNRDEWNYHSKQAKAASFNYEAMRERMRSDDALIAAVEYSRSLEVLARLMEASNDMEHTEKLLRKSLSVLTDRSIINIVKRLRSQDEAYSQSGSTMRSTRVQRAVEVDFNRKEMLITCLEHLIKVLLKRPDVQDEEVREEILRLTAELNQFKTRQDVLKERESGLTTK
eukprot:TRINITY_DN2925_c0_g1_i3.p1 TRINITY_DN2925_c0_g1~~TRINITY_DN2925_c0_g1_i3.p1  ORF type:complete len:270 (-),score=45.06 TRINITY_DN2925_c0_g1_i3:242-1051(-)